MEKRVERIGGKEEEEKEEKEKGGEGGYYCTYKSCVTTVMARFQRA